jgi:hypothetical protein
VVGPVNMTVLIETKAPKIEAIVLVTGRVFSLNHRRPCVCPGSSRPVFSQPSLSISLESFAAITANNFAVSKTKI